MPPFAAGWQPVAACAAGLDAPKEEFARKRRGLEAGGRLAWLTWLQSLPACAAGRQPVAACAAGLDAPKKSLLGDIEAWRPEAGWPGWPGWAAATKVWKEVSHARRSRRSAD